MLDRVQSYSWGWYLYVSRGTLPVDKSESVGLYVVLIQAVDKSVFIERHAWRPPVFDPLSHADVACLMVRSYPICLSLTS